MKDVSDMQKLLEIVSPELVTSYENNVLIPQGKGRLSALLVQHKEVVEQIRKITKSYMVAEIAEIVAVATSGIGAIFSFTSHPAVCLGYLLFFFWFLFIGCRRFLKKSDGKLKKIETEMEEMEGIFDEFRRNLERLDSPVGRTMFEYTANSVLGNLLTYAMQILDAEQKLDLECSRPHKDVFQINHLTTWIMTKQSKLRAAEEAAKLFGLKYDKTELFKDAAKYIRRPVA